MNTALNVTFAAPDRLVLRDLTPGSVFAHIEEGTVRAFALLHLGDEHAAVANLTDPCLCELPVTDEVYSARVTGIELPHYLRDVVGHTVDVSTGDQPPEAAAAPASPPTDDATSIDAGAVSGRLPGPSPVPPGETATGGGPERELPARMRAASERSGPPRSPLSRRRRSSVEGDADAAERELTDGDVEASVLARCVRAAGGELEQSADEWAETLGRPNRKGIYSVLGVRAAAIGATVELVRELTYKVTL